MVTASGPSASAMRTARAAMAARSFRGLGPRVPRSGRSQTDSPAPDAIALLPSFSVQCTWYCRKHRTLHGEKRSAATARTQVGTGETANEDHVGNDSDCG